MAGFQVHAVTALAISASVASYATAWHHFPLTWGLSLGFLGLVGGLLPDIDSGEARISRYSALIFGAVSSLFVYLFYQNIWAALLLFVPFAKGIHYALTTWTTHRGVFHSVPMCVLLSIGAYYGADLLRFPHFYALYCAAFLGGGYLVHLVLDEIWSLRKGISKHCSFGTALQFFRRSFWPSFLATYALLAVVVYYTPFLRAWVEQTIRGIY